MNSHIERFAMMAMLATGTIATLGADGCSTTSAAPTSPCSPNPGLDAACPDPSSVGYSCAPGDNPMTYDATLLCSVDSAGTGDFCCTTSAGGGGGACTADPTLACDPGTDGWTCTSGTAVPAANGVDYICSVPQKDSAGNDTYCCATTTFAPGTCTADPTVAGCAFPSLGFSCAGTDTPDQTDSSLVCSTGTADPATGDTLFCCCTGGSC
jgi:hypothetical protein